jgi:transposase
VPKKGACIDPHGFDAGKLIKGKKRHILVDTLGLVLHTLVTGADVQDRDGGILLLATLFGQFPFLRKLFADSAYAGPAFRDGAAKAIHNLDVEIVKRSDCAKGFVVLPKRWIVPGCTKVPACALSGWNGSSGFTCKQNFTPPQSR